ncbi:hypothetical protein JCM8097_001004 [Rhodosporidiobolus ruineniae]
MPPPLPRELMEQILGDERLDERTLARCCRISRDYLDFVRTRLYSHVDILYTPADVQIYDDAAYVYDTQSAALLFTLGRYPHLGGLVRSAAFRMDGYPASNICMTRRQAVVSVVNACPKLRRLGCPAWAETEVYHFLKKVKERSFTLLDLGFPQDGIWAVLEQRQSSIEHLVFLNSDMGWSFSSAPPDKPLDNLRLRSLIIDQYADETDPVSEVLRALTSASHHSLSFLRIDFNPYIRSNLGVFSSLAKLELNTHEGDDMSDLLAALYTANHLTYLALHGSATPGQREHLLRPGNGLATHLPSTIRALYLPQNFLPDELQALLPELSRLSALRLVGFTPPSQPIRLRIWPTDPSPSPGPLVPDYAGAVQKYAERNLHLVEMDGSWDSDTTCYLRRLRERSIHERHFGIMQKGKQEERKEGRKKRSGI